MGVGETTHCRQQISSHTSEVGGLVDERGDHQEGTSEFAQAQCPLLGCELRLLLVEAQPPGGDLLLHLRPAILRLQLTCTGRQTAAQCMRVEKLRSHLHLDAIACYCNTNTNTLHVRHKIYALTWHVCLYQGLH